MISVYSVPFVVLFVMVFRPMVMDVGSHVPHLDALTAVHKFDVVRNGLNLIHETIFKGHADSKIDIRSRKAADLIGGG